MNIICRNGNKSILNAIINRKERKFCLSKAFNFKLGRFATKRSLRAQFKWPILELIPSEQVCLLQVHHLLCQLYRCRRRRRRNIWRLAILSTWNFISLAFYQLDILSTWHFVSLTFCQFDILSVWHFVSLTFCQFGILSVWHFINLTFYKHSKKTDTLTNMACSNQAFTLTVD